MTNVEKGDVKEVAVFLDEVPSEKRKEVASSVLFSATRLTHYDPTIAKLALDKGADPDYEQQKGAGTAVCAASMKGDLELMDLLLSKGANPNAAVATSNGRKMYPILGLVCGVAQLDPSIQRQVALKLIAGGANVNGNTDGTPLLSAASSGNLELVKILLAAGADPRVKDNTGHSAAVVASFRCKVDVANFLLAQELKNYGAVATLWDRTMLRHMEENCSSGKYQPPASSTVEGEAPPPIPPT